MINKKTLEEIYKKFDISEYSTNEHDKNPKQLYRDGSLYIEWRLEKHDILGNDSLVLLAMYQEKDEAGEWRKPQIVSRAEIIDKSARIRDKSLHKRLYDAACNVLLSAI